MKKKNVDDFLLKELRVGQKFKRETWKFHEFKLTDFDGITYYYRSLTTPLSYETTNGDLKVTVIR